MLGQAIKIFLTTALLTAVLPSACLAQFNLSSPSTFESELNIEVNPTYPAPNQNVSINLTLYTADLNSAEITWYRNGERVLSGRGETRYAFQTGESGEESRFEVRISLLSGTSFTKTFSITPASVDLLWEADSYVPPFYRGKALHSLQGNVKVVALPQFVKNGRAIPPSELIYNWTNGINAYPSQSGYGKNVLIVKGSVIGRSENIRVTVTDPVSGLSAFRSINIAPMDPEVIFYENDPYYGPLFNEALRGSFALDSDEVQLFAAPFFFTRGDEAMIKYAWRLNREVIASLAGSRTAIFRKPEGVDSGRSIISLEAENANRILQRAQKDLTMEFSN